MDLWLLELATGIFSRLTFADSTEVDAIWSPDGQEVAFASNAKGQNDLYRKRSDAREETVLFESPEGELSEDWSADGRFIIYRHMDARTIHALPLFGDAKPMVLLDSPFTKDEVRLSPDGRWISYQSDESGQNEIYVASFPEMRMKRQVSNGGGVQARWRRDGKELFYLNPEGMIMSVGVKTGPDTIETSPPKALFQTPIVVQAGDQYDVTADGERFLVIEPLDDGGPQITVVLNWAEELAGR